MLWVVGGDELVALVEPALFIIMLGGHCAGGMGWFLDTGYYDKGLGILWAVAVGCVINGQWRLSPLGFSGDMWLKIWR